MNVEVHSTNCSLILGAVNYSIFFGERRVWLPEILYPNISALCRALSALHSVFFSVKANLVFTPFAPVRESDKEIKCKYRGRRSCWLSTLAQEKRSSRLKISVVFRLLLVVFSHNLAFGAIREIINDSSKQ